MTETLFNTEYDTFLSNCENLNWLPFIGNEYKNQLMKTLFIGESHYYNPNNPSERAFEKIFTRLIVNDGGILNLDYPSRLYKNITEIYSKYNNVILWNKISYMNFIQKPMNTINEKPQVQNFKEGWITFIETVKILKPNRCVFWGNTAAEHFNKFCVENGYKHEKVQRIVKINGAYFKISKIEIENKVIEIFFIKHPASRFSVEKWRNKLNEYNLLELS